VGDEPLIKRPSLPVREPRTRGFVARGHTHTAPDDTYCGKSHIERRWDTTFINVAGHTRYMTYPQDCIPRSWLLTFVEDSNEVTAQCYLHSNDFAPQGWYDKFDRTIRLSRPFRS
jgi:hypothetical protein